MSYWWIVILGYFVGSIPWGLLIIKFRLGIDVRRYGSGKTGMTNSLRVAGRSVAIAVLLADAGKAIFMVSLAKALSPEPWIHSAVASAVILGHIWPIFAGFKGGRGIAPGVGASGAVDIWAGAIGLLVFLPIVAIGRIVSLGSVVSVGAVMLTFLFKTINGDAPIPYLLYSVVMGSIIIWMHRDNIRRLLSGSEPKLGAGKES